MGDGMETLPGSHVGIRPKSAGVWLTAENVAIQVRDCPLIGDRTFVGVIETLVVLG